MFYKHQKKTKEKEYRMKVAFVYYSFSSFIKSDYEVLSKHFGVNRVNYRKIRDVFKIAKVVLKSDISFSWFADGWAFFAVIFSKVFRKKSIVVVGGYDVACEPEIKYGLYTKNKLRQYMGKYVLNHADMLLPVSNYVMNACYKYLTHPRDLFVLYNGVDDKKFKPEGRKEDLVITVVSSGLRDIIKVKGIDTFFNAAKWFPDVEFKVFGLSENDIKTLKALDLPKNIELFEYLPQEELIAHYQRAKVYCQLSFIESFGMALAEAMSSECIPVVTNRGALPEVVGNTGFYVPYGNPETTAKAIKEALKSGKGKEARQRIENVFPIERREKELIQIVNEVMKCKSQ